MSNVLQYNRKVNKLEEKEMNKVKNIKRTFAIAAIVMLCLTLNIFTNNVDAALVAMSVSPLSTTTVEEGGSVSFTLTYTGDVNYIQLSTKSIGFTGFHAKVSLSSFSKLVRGRQEQNVVVTLSNIRPDGSGNENRIRIAGGTASSSDGKLANAGHTQRFTIKPKTPADTIAPVATITGPNPGSIYAGGTVNYTVNYTDNVGIARINLTSNSIKLVGFSANVSVSGSGNTRTITLSNVQGNVSSNNYIQIVGGTAMDAAGNLCNSVTSNKFSIIKKTEEPKDTIAPVATITGPEPSSIYAGGTVKYVVNYTDDIGIARINLTSNSIKLVGFSANISISGSGNTRTITLSNVQGNVSSNNYIQIVGGTAIDAAGNLCNSVTSNKFSIIKKADNNKPDDNKPNDNKPDDNKNDDKNNNNDKKNKTRDWVANPNTGK